MPNHSAIAEGNGIVNVPPYRTAEEELVAAQQQELLRTLIRIKKQKPAFRLFGILLAIFVIVAISVLELFLLYHIIHLEAEPVGTLLGLAIASVASITLIVVFVLIGVFRGFGTKVWKKPLWHPLLATWSRRAYLESSRINH